MAENVWQLEHETAGHTAYTVRKQKVTNVHLLALFSSLHAVWNHSPQNGPPTFRVNLPSHLNQSNICEFLPHVARDLSPRFF